MNTKILHMLLLGWILVSFLQTMKGNMQKDIFVFLPLTEDERKELVFKQHSPTEGCQFCGYFTSQTNFSCVGCLFCGYFTSQTNFSCVGCFSCERHLWGCFCCCCCKKCQNVTALFLQ
ncbi:protein E6A [Equid gammaherpesvirus 2]|nr:protein E6A [Equid gammaherpesvirus 2]